MNRLAWFVAGVIAVLLICIGVQLYNSATEQATRIKHENNLRAIGLAIHNYHDHYNCLPPALVLGPDQKAWHSWRVLLLPFLGESELYSQYRFDEPWDGPHNRKLIARAPSVYSLSGSKTPYHGVISQQTAWPAQYVLTFAAFLNGSSNSILLVTDFDSDIEWSEPRELSYREAWQKNQKLPSKVCLALFADGDVRSIGRIKEEWLFATYLCIQGQDLVTSQPLAGLPPGFLEAADAAESRRVGADQLQRTVVLPSSFQSVAADKSALWCATFQIAWDQMRQKFKGDLEAPTDQIELGKLLDAHPFPKTAIDPAAVLVSAALDVERAAQPEIIVQAELQKALKFFPEFEEHPFGMKFEDASGKTTNVASFGISNAGADGLGTPVWTDTVVVRDYVSDQDFVLELSTQGTHNDKVILSCCEPQTSLAATWQQIAERIKSPHKWHDRKSVTSSEILMVPVIDLQLEKQFDELYGTRLMDGDHLVGTVSQADQMIQLRLDRRGTTLISKARVSISISEDDEPPPPKKPRCFRFDRPFFLALIEDGANEPYLLAWIAHAELMIEM